MGSEIVPSGKPSVALPNRRARTWTGIVIAYFVLSAAGLYWAVNVMPSSNSGPGWWIGSILTINFGVAVAAILVWAHARKVGLIQSFADVVSALLFLSVGVVVGALFVSPRYSRFVAIGCAVGAIPFARSVRPTSVKLTQALFRAFRYRGTLNE